MRVFHLAGLMLLAQIPVATGLATASLAGMNKDLEDCTAADRPASTAACTRVMASGRLPDNQLYIGHHNRGWSHFNAGDPDKALADFDKSLKYNSDYADTYYARAVVQHARGEREKSLGDLDRYLEKKKDDWMARFNRALMFRWRGEPDRAFSEVQKAASLNPGENKIAPLRALVLSDLGEQGPARAEADKAITAMPGEAQGYYARAVISFREKKLDAAASGAEKAVSLKDAFPAAHTLMGRISEERGDRDKAVGHYQRSLALPAKSVDARAAHDEARERLAALPGSVPAETARKGDGSAKVAARTASGSDCRRFIPAASITIAVDCTE